MTEIEQIRDRLLNEYTVVNGMITNPGKFEGEPLWVAYYMEIGDPDETLYGGNGGQMYLAWYPDKDEQAAFPELDKAAAVVLIEREAGFVDSMKFMSDESFTAFWDGIEDDTDSAEWED